VLSETAIEPHTLWLELTESTLMDDTLATGALLAALRELDVRLALDDFGTGYSSLSYLCRLPVGMLKLDRSFITAMERDSGSRAVVQAVTALAHALEIQVTAEGVETAGQLEHLRTLGCDWVQGYYISTPLPPDAIGPLLGTPSPWSAASTNQSP
jgi:EAL domain-containing protein (putative c-di-GMP-specific phosphodiesterase class I)